VFVDDQLPWLEDERAGEDDHRAEDEEGPCQASSRSARPGWMWRIRVTVPVVPTHREPAKDPG
jgi:hypothetical protein